jgi:ribosomal protein L21E
MKKKHKGIREKGKVRLSRMFQKLEPGSKVAVVPELSEKLNFPKRLQGKSGVVEGKQGKVYVVKIKDIGREKRYLIKPIHLKKLE